MKKNKQIKKQIILGTMVIFLLGILIFSSPLQGTAVLTQDQQPPIDIPQPGKPFDIPGNGTPVELIPGEKLILQTPSGVVVNLIVGEGVSISINEIIINPAGELPANASTLGKYLEIELNNSEVEVEATLSMPYTDGDLPEGVAEEQLYFAFYDVATGEWRGVPSWVDTVNNVVYANTTHFSTWTVLGSTSLSTILPQLWLVINNVKDGFLISFTMLSLFLVVVALVNRRHK